MSVDLQLVFENEFADLFDLISFRLRAARLQVDDLINALSEVDVMAAFAVAKGKACASQDETPIVEIEVRVRATFEQASE
jgi:hypothetical protein